MAIDPMEVCRMEIRDSGEPVTIATPEGSVFTRPMIFDDGVDDTALGSMPGAIGQPVFLCLPEDAELIGEGALLTCEDGSEYLVFAEPIRRKNQFTEIRVNEQ
ncbi:hypothetical protein [uncultured Desulfuromusa sp.]|uniref:hypothetical protein n=1 Tax=uncultured Desulfuromusa sp. TaxID=219183 RepID=UPI002AA8D8FC|nr:hypothetical protein [uncultured Desulfuromusa sp.]